MPLIDPEGGVWPGVTPDLVAKLQSSLTGEELSDYLVRNLGWIKVVMSRSNCLIWFRERINSEPALAALLFCVHDCKPGTAFAINLLTDQWTNQVLRDRQSVTTVLTALMAPARPWSTWSGDRFLCKSVSANQSPFASTWQEAVQLIEGHFDDFDTIVSKLRRLLGPRFAICTFDEAEGDWVETYNSGGFTPFNPLYSGQQRGAHLSDYALDAAYCNWIAAHRASVLARDEVDFSIVDAIVTFQRLGETRLRYCRMVAPVRLGRERAALLIAARTSTEVDLRRQP